MIDIADLEQYFPNINNQIIVEPFRFRISLSQDRDEEIFVINLKIKQKDTKKDHLIKFRLGMGKDKKTLSGTHDTHKPHFEIDIYKREKESFSANIYFTFDTNSDDELLEYAKGTIVLIYKIINKFFKTNSLDVNIINDLIYSEAVIEELSTFEPKLMDALFNCYLSSNLIVRQKGELFVIKTPHNLSKYLGVDDLEPLYLPLLEKIN